MSDSIAAHARRLQAEARQENERRGLVLIGDREDGYDVLETILEGLEAPISRTTLVGPADRLRCEQRTQHETSGLLGTTRDVVIVDAHEGLEPNTIGRVVGTIDGGGLFILLTPPLEEWAETRDAFDESLVVAPYTLEDVSGRLRRRLVETIRAHRGLAIVDVGSGEIVDEGLTNPAPKLERVGRSNTETTEAIADTESRANREGDGIRETAHQVGEKDPKTEASFPCLAYDACRTDDQATALGHLEALSEPGRAVVLEADRGRGKSSAIGLAAGSFAATGSRVLVTAPDRSNVDDVFARARELLEDLAAHRPADTAGELNRTAVEPGRTAVEPGRTAEVPQSVTASGGDIQYLPPLEATDQLSEFDFVFVDEAAALPVAVLEDFLDAERIAFATTVHGYEGAGRGFSVRFRDRLAASDHAVTEYTLTEPIRYAGGDPLEVWSFHALLLDARPVVPDLLEDATLDTVNYRKLDAETLRGNERLLRETFGLLVLAHYRTEPNDLARLLDAPNLETYALTYEGHVVSVALVAREGNLERADQRRLYEGARLRGNMIPDLFSSHLRDEAAGGLAGGRVVRIATHHAVRSAGFGSLLLEELAEDVEPSVDWLGTGFGATPSLVSFWHQNGYRPLHLSTTRNDASGEYSVIMCRAMSKDGQAFVDRHERWFVRRLPNVLADSLRELDPDVVRAITRSLDPAYAPPLELTDNEWELVAGAAYGPALFDVDPGPFSRLVYRYLLERAGGGPEPDESTGRGTAWGGEPLDPHTEQLLIRRVLQCHPWARVATDLDYHSSRACKRALGNALEILVDTHGTDTARSVKSRFQE
ncbi:GNAT family N-acetyltransferase [Halobacteria archaeon AArc-curdl1]|uniref:tRNA(Met) cytidine acetyltransferase TmcA n=1 Tax=Natronosalvus hydrolyticus TaxID=2979988 RepID=A0AAP2Z9W4_9EURY|nr:GNAT family N-acetyltransferase [Halobacteria archaeon AArc-curdl1]